MDLTHHLLQALLTPDYVFKHAELLTEHTENYAAKSSSSPPSDETKRLMISSRPVPNLWRVDGATICGTRFFCTPAPPAAGVAPSRVDVHIPDQAQHPQELRGRLQSHTVVVDRDSQQIAKAGISEYICNVLSYHSARTPAWLEQYHQLPFGSRVMFHNIAHDITNTLVSFVPMYTIERQSVSWHTLQEKWSRQVAKERWPPVVPLEQLRLVKQLHDSVSLVQVDTGPLPRSEPLIFKSSTDDLAHLYHELHFLLTVPKHAHIMPQPEAIVVKKARFGSRHGVIGFILPYFPGGSIRDEIPRAMKAGTLTLTRQFELSEQVLSALLHVVEEGKTFYSDLRLDNVIFKHANPFADCTSDGIDVALCDFEQRGNWHEWCPPEVLYAQYIQNIARDPRSADPNCPWHDVVADYQASLCLPSDVDLAVTKKNTPWFRLSETSREKAMAYSFGIFMYCIFEGLPNPRVNIANAYPIEPGLEFPEYSHTPPIIRRLINDCTTDATPCTETYLPGKSRPSGVFREGYKVYPRDRSMTDIKTMRQADISRAVLESANDFWLAELNKAKTFMNEGLLKDHDFSAERPTLREIKTRLEDAKHQDGCRI